MRAVSTAASGVRHVMGVSLQALIVVAIIAALLVAASVINRTAPAGAASALAARGGHASGGTTDGGTISLKMVYDANDDSSPNQGDVVTFDVSTGATSQPWVRLTCVRDGTIVLDAARGIFPTSLSKNFTLGSSMWSAGSAACTATLQDWDSYSKNGKITNLRSMTFDVSS
jgi:hypothetical protein